jgi:hypothetical protein
MKFFVAKVNLKEQLKTGYTTLRPLQFAFESEKFMLPMRLGMLNAAPDKPQDLIIYLLTKEGRVESSNYRTVKLPANMNLPFFIKPKFQDFYKALFSTSPRRKTTAWCSPSIFGTWPGATPAPPTPSAQTSCARQGCSGLTAMRMTTFRRQ